MTMMRLLNAVAGFLIACPVLVAQHKHASLQSALSEVRELPGTINGSKTPELIPDALAIRLFLISVAQPSGVSEVQDALQNIKLRRLRLAPSDSEIVKAELRSFHADLSAINMRMQVVRGRMNPGAMPGSATYHSLVALDSEISALSERSYERLLTNVTPDGAAKIREHVLVHMKTKIVLAPPPLM